MQSAMEGYQKRMRTGMMMAGYEVAYIYSENRESIGISIEQGLKDALAGRNIEVEKVLMRDVQLPEMVQGKVICSGIILRLYNNSLIHPIIL
jgi:regulator of protease activity HflC (stomatin/prohibitin superfamily)